MSHDPELVAALFRFHNMWRSSPAPNEALSWLGLRIGAARGWCVCGTAGARRCWARSSKGEWPVAIVEYVFTSKKPFYSGEATALPLFEPRSRTDGAIACVPVLVGRESAADEVVAVLVFDSPSDPRAFSLETLDLLAHFADVVRAQLQERPPHAPSEDRVPQSPAEGLSDLDHAKAMTPLSGVVRSSSDVHRLWLAGYTPENAIRLLLAAFLEITRAKQGRVAVLDRAGGPRLNVSCLRDGGLANHVPEGVLGRVLRTGDAFLPSTCDGAFLSSGFRRRQSITGVLALPLRAGGELVGGLVVAPFESAPSDPEARCFCEELFSSLAKFAQDRDREGCVVAISRLRQAEADREKAEAQANEERIRRCEETGGDILEIIGNTPARWALVDRTLLYAPSNQVVAIRGPAGSGKELVAHALHKYGPWRNGPFVEMNCAAVPETLVESMVFGVMKGGCSGVTRDMPGLIDQARGGVCFLDEFAEMSLQVQAKFLRVLEYGDFRPIGSDRERKADCRFLVGTNRNLHEMEAQGRLRGDLRARVTKFEIRVPSIRERIRDIPLVAAFHAGRGKPAFRFTSEAEELLVAFGWTGEFRQVVAVVETVRCFLRGGCVAGAGLVEDALEEERLKRRSSSVIDAAATPVPALRPNSARRAADALAAENGNKTRAARRSHLSRQHVGRLCSKGADRP